MYNGDLGYIAVRDRLYAHAQRAARSKRERITVANAVYQAILARNPVG
jgi:hypothetical protein